MPVPARLGRVPGSAAHFRRSRARSPNLSASRRPQRIE